MVKMEIKQQLGTTPLFYSQLLEQCKIAAPSGHGVSFVQKRLRDVFIRTFNQGSVISKHSIMLVPLLLKPKKELNWKSSYGKMLNLTSKNVRN